MSTANKVMEDPSSQEKQDSFIRSLQEVLDSLHHIQSVLGTEIDITSEDETPPPPRHGFAHLRRSRSPDKEVTPAQERTRNMKQAQAKPLYIGSLGANRGQSATIAEQQVKGDQTFVVVVVVVCLFVCLFLVVVLEGCDY